MNENESMIVDLTLSLLALDDLAVGSIIDEIASEMTPLETAEYAIVPALERIGEGWVQGTVALSQVYMSGRICEELVDEILPPSDPDRKDQPRIAIATLEDYHVLGKRIVYATVRASGFELNDFGHGVKAEELVDKTRAEKVEVLLISTLMLRSALRIKDVSRELKGDDHAPKIIVGGAPFLFDAELWREVGADMMCRSASEVIEAIERVTES